MKLCKAVDNNEIKEKNQGLINKIYGDDESYNNQEIENPVNLNVDIDNKTQDKYEYVETIEEEETLSLHDKIELEMIKQALIRTNGRRKKCCKRAWHIRKNII